MRNFYRPIILAMAIFVLLAGCGKDSSSTNGGTEGGGKGKGGAFGNAVYGNWQMPVVQQSGISFAVQMRVDSDRITMTNACAYNGNSVTATASSPAEISTTEVKVLSPSEDKKTLTIPQGDLNCSISLVAGTMPYQINGTKLKLTDPKTGQSFELDRL